MVATVQRSKFWVAPPQVPPLVLQEPPLLLAVALPLAHVYAPPFFKETLEAKIAATASFFIIKVEWLQNEQMQLTSK